MHLLKEISRILKEKSLTISTIESCTGGLLSHLLTNISGSSDYFKQGWIVYSNTAKQKQLNIPLKSIKQYGAVSSIIARKMVAEGFKKSNTDFVIAITGIAGPTGATANKPVGTVFIALRTPNNKIFVKKNAFKGTRLQIKKKSAEKALKLLYQHLKES